MILKNGRFAIHEVFYDDEGEPWTCTEEPVCPEGDPVDALREELKHYQRALEWPVLEYADLVSGYDSSGLDIEEAFCVMSKVHHYLRRCTVVRCILGAERGGRAPVPARCVPERWRLSLWVRKD